MKNHEVVNAFLEGRKAANIRRSLRSDGNRLWSYSVCIAVRRGREMAVGNYTVSGSYYSQTTSKHVKLTERISGRKAIAPIMFSMLK